MMVENEYDQSVSTKGVPSDGVNLSVYLMYKCGISFSFITALSK